MIGRTMALFALAGVALATSPVLAQPKPTTGKVTSVTLYRGQALVTRNVPLEGGKGSHEVVVTDLPQQIIDGSLYAEAGEGVEVRAVRLRQRAVGQEPREEVRKIDLLIQETGDKLAVNTKNQELAGKKAAYLDGLEGFVAPTAKTELSKGVLNAEALEKITNFSFSERQKISAEQNTLTKEHRELSEQLKLLQEKKAELTSGSQRTTNEAVLFVDKKNDAAEGVRLNYLVKNCGWSPAYTMRAGKERKDVEVEYNALIHQMTGEDWGGVALTLSTASPALSSSGPGLAPFYVALGSPPANKQPQQGQAALQQADYANTVKELRGKQSLAVMKSQSAANFAENLDFSWTVNAAANDVQCLELTGGKEVIYSLRGEGGGADGPSLSYRLDGGVSLASRSDQQMVRIMKTPLPASFYHVATPVLSSYVYREAELKNSGAEDLLAGPVSVYLEGRFVGKGEIPTVARGETFLVGFGADPQLRARRELLDKKEGVQGGNRELSFKYRLAIENYKNEAATVRVVDRLPFNEHGGDLRVTLGDLKTPLSNDPTYQRTERSKGMLRWDVEVAAGATAEKPQVVEYQFTVDYDRNFLLTAASAHPEQQQEFEQLQRARQKK